METNKSKRKKKGKGTHFTAAPGVDKESVAGKMRSRNQRIADMADELEN